MYRGFTRRRIGHDNHRTINNAKYKHPRRRLRGNRKTRRLRRRLGARSRSKHRRVAKIMRARRREIIAMECASAKRRLELESLRKLLNPRVKILAVTHSSNIIGSVNPIGEVIKLCREIGARVIVDGVSYAPHRLPQSPNYNRTLTHSAPTKPTPRTSACYTPRRISPPIWTRNATISTPPTPQKNWTRRDPTTHPSPALAGLGEYFAASYQHHFGDNDASLTLHEKQTPYPK